jgi:hypothetical protein
MSWHDFQDADPMTSAVMVKLDEFHASTEHKVDALRAAANALETAEDLGRHLEKTAEYCVAGDAMMKVRDRN